MKNLPVSVIIPCYNCSDTIFRAFQSILEQAKRPREVIFIDDCSNDNGATKAVIDKIINNYQEDFTIHLIKMKVNKGAASARNAGWDIATQKYIAFLDADDIWHKDKLKIQVYWMENHPEAVLLGHGYKKYKENTDIDYSQLNFRKIHKYMMLFKNWFPTPTVMLRKDIKYRFKEGKRYSEDFLLWLQVCFFYKEVYLFDKVLAYRFKANYGESGLSNHLWEMEKGELDTYKELYNSRFIFKGTLIFVYIVSLFKYMIRIIKVRILTKG